MTRSLNNIIKRVLITFILLISLVSLGAAIHLHIDGSTDSGHLHSCSIVFPPIANKAGHVDIVPVITVDYSADANSVFYDNSFLPSFDKAANLPERAPPA